MATPVGLKNLYYALLDTDPVGGTPTYQAPVRIVGAIKANINPNAASETLFADDGPMETATALGKIELELETADLPLDVQAVLLGHTRAGGVLYRKAEDIPPWVAIGFKSMKSNGKYRFVWLVKGKFLVPELNHETKKEGITFQTPTIKGVFAKRDSDDVWIKQTDEDDADYTASIGANWFTTVEGTPDTTPPTVTTNILDGDTGVSLSTTVVFTFSETLLTSCINTGNFFLMTASGTTVDGTLAVDATRKIVTFTPDANLVTATDYIAVATVGAKDVAGNSIATNKVVNFTTA